MKQLVFILITSIICLIGCKREEFIDNSMLLRGKAGHLWVLRHRNRYIWDDANSQYVWFDRYGRCQVLELGRAKEPNLVIMDESLISNPDSCVDNIPVLLDGLPYRMKQSCGGWVNTEEYEVDSFLSLPPSAYEATYLESEKKYVISSKLLTRTCTPDWENYEWYRKIYMDYRPRGEKLWWFLTEIFMPKENHPLNGTWQNLSDSLILLNGQPYRIVERMIRRGEGDWIYWDLSDRELILCNLETGDSIRLLDACIPPSPYWITEQELYNEEGGYEKWMKKRGKSIKSSDLLNGEKFKLYRLYQRDIENYWHNGNTFLYFDDSGYCTSFYQAADGAFSNTIADDLDWSRLWYQQGKTIVESHWKYTISEILSSGDTILFRDDNNKEFMYIDAKLPSLKNRK